MAANRDREPVRYEEPDLSNPANRHEHSDIDYKAVTKFGVALTLLCILTFGFLIYVFRHFLAREAALQPAQPAAVDMRRLPPEPRLQATPIPDLKAIRAAEDEILTSYGWVDAGKGVARIPVSHAIDLLAARGLPSRPAADAPRSDVTVPTDSTLGPKMQRVGGPLADELAEATAAPAEEAKQPAAPASAASHETKH
jgi:hypothetical protein